MRFRDSVRYVSFEMLKLQGFRAEKMGGGDCGWNALLLWDLGEVLVEE